MREGRKEICPNDQPVEEIRVKQNGDVLRRALVPYALLGIALATLVPERGASFLSTELSLLVSAVAEIVPTVANLPTVTTFPSVAEIYLLLMLLVMPSPAILLACKWSFSPRLLSLKTADQLVVFTSLAFIALLSIILLTQFPDVTSEAISAQGGRGGWLVRLVTQSRFGLAIFGTAFFACAAGTIGVAMAHAKAIITIHIQRNNHGRTN